MLLTRHLMVDGQAWAVDGKLLPKDTTFGSLLSVTRREMKEYLEGVAHSGAEVGHAPSLAPVEADHEVWACGVTYLRSRVEREAESSVADVYARVYDASRPELFFKSVGSRVIGHEGKIRIRRDSTWNVPEPELTLAVNRFGEIVGYTVGNDVSSRSIEGENPLYLPQAKTYDGACALGPGILLSYPEDMVDLPIKLAIQRKGEVAFEGEANTSQIKRTLGELVEHLTRETAFPKGALLLTGTCIVPGQPFTLLEGDFVTITVGDLTLANEVDRNP